MAQRFAHAVSPDLIEKCIGANSVQFSVGDPVYIDSSGFLALATAGSQVIGFANENKTCTSSNQTVAKYEVQYVPGYPFVKMIITADQACVQTDVGAYCDVGTGTTGAFVLNLSAGSSGQFFIWDFDVNKDGTTTEILVSVAEPQYLAFAQV